MALGGRGPRDWSPTERSSGSRGAARATRSAYAATRPRRSGSAGLAILLGVVAILIAFLQPGTGQGAGFFASTIGITAIAIGVRALRANRYGPHRTTAMARAAIALGSLGTAAMLYSFLVFALAHLGVVLPPDPLTLDRMFPSVNTSSSFPAGVAALPAPSARPSTAVPAGAAPTAAAPSTHAAVAPSAPTPTKQLFATPASASAENQQLFYVVAGLHTTLRTTHPAGSTWPASLRVVQESDSQLITLPTGRVLGSIPTASRLIYTVSSDRSEYSIDIIGSTYGVDVHYDSASGAITGPFVG